MSRQHHRFVQTGRFRTGYHEGGAGETVILIHGGGAGADALPHCRHRAMLEYPEIFSRVCLDFLLRAP